MSFVLCSEEHYRTGTFTIGNSKAIHLQVILLIFQKVSMEFLRTAVFFPS